MNREDAKIGDMVTALGKPGIVIDILDGQDSSCFRLKSANLIMRDQHFHDYSEIIDFGDWVKPTTTDVLLKDADRCIEGLKEIIANLEQFKREIKQNG